MYEQHPFWCTGYTFWDLHSEAPDLFLHLSRSDLVFFKGDLNHRKLTYDCAAPASTPFDVAIGPMASSAGAPKVASLRTIKSDVVVGLGEDGDEVAEQLDEAEPGWKISGKYVSSDSSCRGGTWNTLFFLLGRSSPFRGSPWRESPLCLDVFLEHRWLLDSSLSRANLFLRITTNRLKNLYPHTLHRRSLYFGNSFTPIFSPLFDDSSVCIVHVHAENQFRISRTLVLNVAIEDMIDIKLRLEYTNTP